MPCYRPFKSDYFLHVTSIQEFIPVTDPRMINVPSVLLSDTLKQSPVKINNELKVYLFKKRLW